MARPGRVLTLAQSATAVPLVAPAEAVKAKLDRVLSAEVADAHLEAMAIRQSAHARLVREQEERNALFLKELAARQDAFEKECERREAEQALRSLVNEPEWLKAQEKRLQELAAVLAERLLGEQLRLDPEAIVRLTCEVLKETAGARRMVIFAEPADAAKLGEHLNEISELFAARVEVLGDVSLSAGDLVIESELGRTDARKKTRLSCLLQLLSSGQFS